MSEQLSPHTATSQVSRARRLVTGFVIVSTLTVGLGTLQHAGATATVTPAVGPTTTSIEALSSAPPDTLVPDTLVPDTLVEVTDPLFPLTVGSNNPAVAVVQHQLGITVDCDYGNQTAGAVRAWQTERGDVAVTGEIGPHDWALLEVPLVWGDDRNDDGVIAPSEVDIDCADPFFAPQPVFHADWPTTDTGFAAQLCALPGRSELTDFSDPIAYYDPSDDTITISGAGGDDYGAAGDAVFDTLICVLGLVGPPQHVIAQLSSTRALDGMQTAQWEGVFGPVMAIWTYHPSQGMNLVVWTA